MGINLKKINFFKKYDKHYMKAAVSDPVKKIDHVDIFSKKFNIHQSQPRLSIKKV